MVVTVMLQFHQKFVNGEAAKIFNLRKVHLSQNLKDMFMSANPQEVWLQLKQ